MFDRKNDVAKRPSKKPCHASSKSCTSSVVSSPNVWADLLDCLLHQIIALLSSSNDIIAFAATCRSWRAAFTSFPSTLSCNVPPLCLQSHIHYPHRGHSRIKYSLLYNCEWQLTDPPPVACRHPTTIQTACTIWVAHMVILYSPTRISASL